MVGKYFQGQSCSTLVALRKNTTLLVHSLQGPYANAYSLTNFANILSNAPKVTKVAAKKLL